MATATNSTAGEIRLAGDFTGLGVRPQLVDTGVQPGAYATISKLSADSKGRTLAIGAPSQAQKDADIAVAYASNPSFFTIVGGKPMPTWNTPATGSAVGTLQLGTYLGTTTGVLNLQVSTNSILGCFKPADGLKMVGSSLQIDSAALLPSTGGTVQKRFQQTPIEEVSLSNSGGIIGYDSASIGGSHIINLDSRNSIDVATQIIGVSPLYAHAVCASDDTTVCMAFTDVDGNFASAISTDGVTWTTAKITPPNPAGPTTFRGMAYGNGIFVIHGFTSAVGPFTGVSSDGLTWTWTSSVWSSSLIVNQIVFGNGIFVIAYRNSSIKASWLTSIDGVAWTIRGGSGSNVNAGYINTVFDGTYFCSSFSGTTSSTLSLWRSSDGITWTVQTTTGLPASGVISTLATNGSNQIVAAVGVSSATANSLYSSTNGGQAWSANATLSTTSIVSLSWCGAQYTGYSNADSIKGTPGSSWVTYTTAGDGSNHGHSLKIGSTYINPHGSSEIKGYFGSSGLTGDGSTTTDSGNTWVSHPLAVPREILVIVPYNGTSGSPTGFSGSVGLITRLSCNMNMDLYLGFSNPWYTPFYTVKTPARLLAPANVPKIFTMLYIRSNEWLVFEE